MSWEDEDFQVPASEEAGVAEDWEEEAEDDNDQPLLESWDVDIDEIERKKKEEEAQKKAELEALKKKQAAAIAAKKNKKKGEPVLLEIDKVDPETRRRMLKEAEVEADLKNASDLFAGIKVEDNADDDDIDELLGGEDDEEEVKREEKVKITEETPLTIHPLFRVKDKTGYEKLHKALGSEMKRLDEENHLAYVSSLAIDLISTMCEPLNAEQTRKVISTLNAQVTKKLKDERKARLSKTGGTSLGGAGKKKAKGNNLNLGGRDAIGDMLEDEQDYGDDDFM